MPVIIFIILILFLWYIDSKLPVWGISLKRVVFSKSDSIGDVFIDSMKNFFSFIKYLAGHFIAPFSHFNWITAVNAIIHVYIVLVIGRRFLLAKNYKVKGMITLLFNILVSIILPNVVYYIMASYWQASVVKPSEVAWLILDIVNVLIFWFVFAILDKQIFSRLIIKPENNRELKDYLEYLQDYDIRFSKVNGKVPESKELYIYKKDKLDVLKKEQQAIDYYFSEVENLKPYEDPFTECPELLSADTTLIKSIRDYCHKNFDTYAQAYQLLKEEKELLDRDIAGEQKGIDGEDLVFSHIADHDEYKILQGLVISIGENRHSESDLVVINNSGVFVGEIKNWNGELEIGQDGLFVLNGNNCESPIEQNYGHIRNLKKLLEKNGMLQKDIQFKSLIILANDNIDVYNNSNDITVIRASKLTYHIEQQSKQKILTDEQVSQIYNIFKDNHKDTMKVPITSRVERAITLKDVIIFYDGGKVGFKNLTTVI